MRVFMTLFFLTLSTFTHSYSQPQKLYNEGLAYYQQGDIGQATQALKKALILKPSLKEARALYNAIQTEIGGVPSSVDWGTTLFLLVTNIFPPQIDSLISGLLFLLGTTLGSLVILNKIPKKRYMSIIIGLSYMCSGILFIQAYIKYYLIFNKDVRIALISVDILDQPFKDGKAVAHLPAGTEVEAIEENNGYVFVRSLGKQQGWAITNDIPKLWKKS